MDVQTETTDISCVENSNGICNGSIGNKKKICHGLVFRVVNEYDCIIFHNITLRVKIFRKNSRHQNNTKNFKVTIENDRKMIDSDNNTSENDMLNIQFKLTKKALYKLSVYTMDNSMLFSTFISISGLNPVQVIGKSERWPVAIATLNHYLFIAYNDHIRKYSRGILETRYNDIDSGSINDIAVNLQGTMMAAAVSGIFTDENDDSYCRFHKVHIYSLVTGDIIHKLEHCPQQYVTPVLRIEFTTEGQLVIPDVNCLRIYNPQDWNTFEEVKDIAELDVASRIRIYGEHLYVLHASERRIMSISLDTKQVTKILYLSGESQGCNLNGHFTQLFTSFAIDEESGLIFLSDIAAGDIFVHSIEDGVYLGSFQSDHTKLKWPLDVAFSASRFLYVADHGNQSVNMYDLRKL